MIGATVLVVLLLMRSDGSGPSLAAGCDPARPHASGQIEQTIRVADGERRYLLYVPASYGGAQASPLVVSLHAFGGSAQSALRGTGLQATADEEGIVLVMPQGAGETARWNSVLFPPESGEADDLGFIDALLDRVETGLCIDSGRVYAAGMSNGAGMAVRLACNLSKRVAAIAAVAGVYFPPGALELPGEPPCVAERPVPVIAFHGTEDSTVPFLGGTAVFGITLRPIEDAVIPAWAEHNGCAEQPEPLRVTEHVRLVRYRGCEGEAAVELYVIEGGGHQWPGANDGPAPDVADEISANDLIWRFFSAHPLPMAD